MKFLIVFVALFAFALAAPNDVVVEHQESDVGAEHFKHSLKQSDGTEAAAEGHLENVGTDHESLSVKGSYTHFDKDGQKYTVTYIADENGFQPQGAHLPVAPQA